MRQTRKRAGRIVRADEETLPLIESLKAGHPFWGYRRIWAYLKYVKAIPINQKRVYRLMKENDLLVKGNDQLKAKRTASTSKPRPVKPNQWWGMI